MFKYFVQRFFFQIVIVAATAGFVGIFLYAYAIEGANPPPADVKTQFQSSLGKPASKTAIGEPDLSVQHMSGPEISAYLNEIIAEGLSLTPSNYNRTVAGMAKYFTPSAYEQYKNYLTQGNFAQTLSSRSLQSGAYCESPPFEVNSVVQNGIYKWLFEAPVTVSFIPLNAQTYASDQTKAQNQRFTLRVQFARVKDPADPNAIRIEIWEMLAPRR